MRTRICVYVFATVLPLPGSVLGAWYLLKATAQVTGAWLGAGTLWAQTLALSPLLPCLQLNGAFL